jgi:hypothetical protein
MKNASYKHKVFAHVSYRIDAVMHSTIIFKFSTAVHAEGLGSKFSKPLGVRNRASKLAAGF